MRAAGCRQETGQFCGDCGRAGGRPYKACPVLVKKRSFCVFQCGYPTDPGREAGDLIGRPYIACPYVVVWVAKWCHFLAVGRLFASVLFITDRVPDKPYNFRHKRCLAIGVGFGLKFVRLCPFADRAISFSDMSASFWIMSLGLGRAPGLKSGGLGEATPCVATSNDRARRGEKGDYMVAVSGGGASHRLARTFYGLA